MTLREEIDPILQKVRGWKHKDGIRAMPIDKALDQILKLVEQRIPKKKTESKASPNDGGPNHSFRLGYNKGLDDARKALKDDPIL